MGSHIQAPSQVATALSAETCAMGLVHVVEWFLRTPEFRQLNVRSSIAEEVVRSLRRSFAENAQQFAEPPSEPLPSGVPETDVPNSVEPNERTSPLPRDFAAWYRDVRPHLRAVMREAIAELEVREGWLQPDGRATPALHVCVVGQAAVGKSTLINSLLSERLSLLPAGGTGPHTAAAIVVRYATDPYVEIRYVELARIELLKRALRKREVTQDVLSEARMLIEGNQFATTSARDLSKKLGQVLADGDGRLDERLERVRGVVSSIRVGNRTVRHAAGEALLEFFEDLTRHASGSLAPITESVEVGWDTPMLAPGLCLVDLPGFGIASDRHALVAQRELRRARGVLWVVDRSGLTEGTLKELRDVEMFQRLAANNDESVKLTIVVTRLDESASDARRRLPAGQRPRFDEALSETCADAESMIRTQLRDALSHLEPGERERAQEKISVFPVAPIEHRRFYLDDDEEPARVSYPEVTGLPRLRGHLRSLAAARRAHAATQIDTLLDSACQPEHRSLVQRLKSELRTVTRDPS